MFLANGTEVQFLICRTRAVHSAGRQVGREKLFKYQNGSGMVYRKTSIIKCSKLKEPYKSIDSKMQFWLVECFIED